MNNENLSDLDLKISYKTTDADDPINEFYIPCLNHSEEFFRSVGYFRSSIFLITGEAIIDFAKRGGKIYLICSPELTQEDMDTISAGKATIESVTTRYINDDIDILLEQSEDKYAVKVLATLLKVQALEVQIAIKEGGNGIYHAKAGIFSDSQKNQVSFIGSANETWNAWDHRGNHEIIEVFCSWKDAERVQQHKLDFDHLWKSNTPGVRTIQFPEAMKEKLIKVAHDRLDLINPNKPPGTKPDTPPGTRPIIKPDRPWGTKPELPLTRPKKIDNLFDHQGMALENWKLNDYRGIFEHATGSGKTVTALKAIDDHLKIGGAVLILVPSNLLFNQWQDEIKSEIDNPVILLAGGGNTKWKKNNRLEHHVAQSVSETSRIVLSTMKTASSAEFIDSFRKVSNLLIVVDEVHQVGSDMNSRSMGIDASKRLGLSATPKRYGDPEGTQQIIEYFDKIIEPIFTLYDAIKAGRLVEYEYFPHLIHLTPKESEEWKIETEKIKKEIAISNSNNDSFVLSPRAKMLLIQRSRIAKKSKAKINLVKEVIENNYEQGQKWLVYCEDIEQLNEVKEIITNSNHPVYEYHSEMTGDKEQTLALYEHKGGILVSIKCLDEGVDIPSISHALILASSQNPRQFIQRRGRVLRVYGDQKQYAFVHDALIIPIDIEKEPEQLSLLKSEMTRAFEFANNARNPSSKNELLIKATDLGFDLSDIIDEGFEEE